MKPLRVHAAADETVPENFGEWEWGESPNVEGLVNATRVSAADVIKEQIKQDINGWFSTWSGEFLVEIWPDFYVAFDILGALAEGEIEFDDLDELKAFHARVQAVADNLKNAIGIAEGAAES